MSKFTVSYINQATELIYMQKSLAPKYLYVYHVLSLFLLNLNVNIDNTFNIFCYVKAYIYYNMYKA